MEFVCCPKKNFLLCSRYSRRYLCTPERRFGYYGIERKSGVPYTMHTMILQKEDIEHIASLARLRLSEAEKTMYADQLSAVLAYIGMLDEVETDLAEETTQVTGLADVFREDRALDCDVEVRTHIIEEFPEKQHGLLRVKAVFSE